MNVIYYSLCACLFAIKTTCNDVHELAPHRYKEDTPKSIVDEPQCEEVKRTCTGLSENDDLLILECLQSVDPNILAKLRDDCQHIVWNHTRALITDENVKETLLPVCKNDLQNINCQIGSATGSYLKCIVNTKDEIENVDCVNMILRLENAAFYDYRWIANFITHCDKDIERFKCGRLDHDRLTQSETIVCLQNKITEIDKECKREVFRLSEIQADNIKLDRQLYMACAEDQMRYCRQFAPGSGRVFKCLMQHKQDKLTHQCQNHLTRRQKLIAQDYRISKGLMRSCKEEIKKYHCRKSISDDKSIRLAQILLCLENVARNGTRIDSDCEIEMGDHRKILMEDYRLSPEIVDGCSADIKKFCNELEVGGKTLHCLMEHATLKNIKKRISDVCQRALETLFKEADIGEDWRVDPVLHDACYPVVQTHCKGIHGGDARVMSCLMDQIGADHMTEDCEDALIQIQYFVARDFKLDPQLYRACREDAKRFCHADKDWEDNNTYKPNSGPLVLPCLYRYAYPEDDKMQLKDQCFDEIKRVMRQRAISVDLLPEIEDTCLGDLALYCYDKTKKGEEMLCLQDNLDKLGDKCKDAIEHFTEMEAQNTELNPYVMTHCKKIIQILCPESKSDEGNIMECLIAHKNDPIVKANNKCRISIEHFQLITLKDYKFSYKFKIACKSYAMRFCPSAKSKAGVVSCLSEKVTNDTIAGIKSDVQKECRQQLKAQLFQQRENINYDQKLAHACKEDIAVHCRHVEPGSAQVLECLQSTPEKKLTEACQVELFKVKKQEITDNSVDYALMTMCAQTIQTFCPDVEHNHVLECLKRNKAEKGFNKKCLMVVKHRIIEQNTDYRLNPSLQENCNMDIKKFCFDVVAKSKPEKELNGEVIKCLKDAFKHSKLTNKCEKEMSGILRDQALDLQLNPLLRAVCKNELETICRQDGEEESVNAEECLKVALLNKKIPTKMCQNEVANMIGESEADIHVDPLLQHTCALDLLKYCNDIPQGNGRQLKCLKFLMPDRTKQLTPECKAMLNKRLEMYRNAAELVVPPADLRELYVQVVESPAKHYFFFVILMVVGTMFVIGMFCGRVTKRHMFIKNK